MQPQNVSKYMYRAGQNQYAYAKIFDEYGNNRKLNTIQQQTVKQR